MSKKLRRPLTHVNLFSWIHSFFAESKHFATLNVVVSQLVATRFSSCSESACDTDNSFPHSFTMFKLIKLSVYLFCAGGCIYQVSQILPIYFSYSSTTELSIRIHETLIPHDMSYCVGCVDVLEFERYFNYKNISFNYDVSSYTGLGDDSPCQLYRGNEFHAFRYTAHASWCTVTKAALQGHYRL